MILTIKIMVLISLLILKCSAGFEAADGKTESREAMTGENITISTRIPPSERDPQVLFTRMNGSSEDKLAQLICHERCDREYWESGVLLGFDGVNVTLMLMNVSRSHTGLYKASVLSGEQTIKCFNVTVNEPPPRPISTESPASLMDSPSSTADRTAAAVLPILCVILFGVVFGYIYWKLKKRVFTPVPNEETGR